MKYEVQRTRCNRRQRRGLVLIVTLVCLGVIVGLLMMAMQTSLQQTRRLDRELQMEQTRWLARAASVQAENLLGDEDKAMQSLQLERYPDAEVTIERASTAESAKANIRARIGLQDRPELQTQIIISTELGAKIPAETSENQQ